jgi:hypothetical protein
MRARWHHRADGELTRCKALCVCALATTALVMACSLPKSELPSRTSICMAKPGNNLLAVELERENDVAREDFSVRAFETSPRLKRRLQRQR